MIYCLVFFNSKIQALHAKERIERCATKPIIMNITFIPNSEKFQGFPFPKPVKHPVQHQSGIPRGGIIEYILPVNIAMDMEFGYQIKSVSFTIQELTFLYSHGDSIKDFLEKVSNIMIKTCKHSSATSTIDKAMLVFEDKIKAHVFLNLLNECCPDEAKCLMDMLIGIEISKNPFEGMKRFVGMPDVPDKTVVHRSVVMDDFFKFSTQNVIHEMFLQLF